MVLRRQPGGPLVEVCYLIDADDTVVWSDRSASPSALPDSRARWEAIWQHRHHLVEVAHSHPRGPLRFSLEDRTTMAAIDAALGRALRYAVVTAGATLRKAPDNTVWVEKNEPAWVPELRTASGIAVPTLERSENAWPS